MQPAILILTGGKSSRMHQDKATMPYLGVTFLEHITSIFSNYEHKYLSVNQHQNFKISNYINIVDEYDAIGPVSGIVSAFHQSKEDCFFVTAIDMPKMKAEVVDVLYKELEDYDGVFVEDDKHFHCMGAIISRKMLEKFEKSIEEKDYRLYHIIKQCHIKVIFTHDYQDMYQNINTPLEYEKIL